MKEKRPASSKKRERTKPGPQVHGPPLWTGSMDPLFGPGAWTPYLDWVHGPPIWTGCMDPLFGPGPWTTSLDRVHGPPLFGPGAWTPYLDRVHGPPIWTGSMDPLFFIPKKMEKRRRRHTTHIASLLFSQ